MQDHSQSVFISWKSKNERENGVWLSLIFSSDQNLFLLPILFVNFELSEGKEKWF